jgi:hypothetical protein
LPPHPTSAAASPTLPVSHASRKRRFSPTFSLETEDSLGVS